MTEIRTQDKLFLAIALPVAALVAYAYFWRIDAGKRFSALEARSAALVTAEDFPFEKRRAEQARAAAEAERDAERKIPMPAAKVKADAAATDAARERNVFDVMRSSGLAVVRSELGEDAAAAAVLRATGVCPRPITRVYSADGTFPQLLSALDAFQAREAAVIVSSVEMDPRARPRWKARISE